MGVDAGGSLPGPAEADPLRAVGDLVEGFGVGGRRLRCAVARLGEAPQTVEELVRGCALPRRTVEALLRAAGADLVPADGGGWMLRADRVEAYRQRFGHTRLRASEPVDPLGQLLAEHAGLSGRLAADIAAAPSGNPALDQVSATAETVLRRAVWLDATFELAGRRLLCVGDHDLTSVAVAAVNPDVTVTVVDVDERLLEYLDTLAAERGLAIRCLYGDLRFGLPAAAGGSADLVFTDPPYTAEGVRLFVGRGLQGLGDRINGRVVLAYGFSPLQPALGWKVQQAVLDLGVVVESMLPAFNRYHGAQAVGSASDLYVCRPTARTWQVLDRKLADAVTNMYTHGGQSLEGGGVGLSGEVAEAVLRAAAEGGGEPAVLVGAGWPAAGEAGARVVSLGEVFGGGLPPLVSAGRGPVRVAVNLADDPGPWLVRLLLAVNADRVAVLVPNAHPDLASAAAQGALGELVAAKYALRLRRSTPTSRYAIVEATAARPAGDGADGDGAALAGWLLSRAHSKLGNVLREGLIRTAGAGGAAMTKNEARRLAAALVPRPDWLDTRLIELPRHAIGQLLAAVHARTGSLR